MHRRRRIPGQPSSRPGALGARALDTIRNEDVQRLKHQLLHKAPKTVNNILTVLNVMLKQAVEWDVIERMPCTIKLLPVSKHATRFYDFEEFERLVVAAKAMDGRAYLLVLPSGEAGLRLGEMVALEWGDIDFVKGQVCVQRSAWKGQVASPKSGRLRYVPLTRRLRSALRDHRHLRGPLVLYQDDGAPLTEGQVQGFVRRAAQRAGLFNNGPHMLRHTFCSHLAMRGAPARAIQELAGHQDLTTTQRYMHLSPAALDRAIELLDAPPAASGRGDILETEKGQPAKSGEEESGVLLRSAAREMMCSPNYGGQPSLACQPKLAEEVGSIRRRAKADGSPTVAGRPPSFGCATNRLLAELRRTAFAGLPAEARRGGGIDPQASEG